MPGPSQTPATNPWRFLVSDTLRFAGIDQGIDFTGSGSVFAPADAVVTRVERGGSGWPGEGAVLNLKLLSGPKAGSFVYIAEDFAPRSDLVRGKVVRRGETVGQATGSGKAPGIEVGWAQPSGVPLAPRPAPRPANQFTTQGADFAAWVRGGASPTPVSQAPIAAPVKDAKKVVGAALAIPEFLGKITNPHNILRGLQIVAGAVLVLVGVTLLARQVGLAADLPAPPIPPGFPPVE